MATNNPFDDIDEKSLAKIDALKGSEDSKIKVDEEWLMLAEFAKHFGWEAYKDAKADMVQTDEMMILIAAARKLDHLTLYNNARAAFIGAGSAQSKKPSNAFNTMTRDIIKQIKADE